MPLRFIFLHWLTQPTSNTNLAPFWVGFCFVCSFFVFLLGSHLSLATTWPGGSAQPPSCEHCWQGGIVSWRAVKSCSAHMKPVRGDVSCALCTRLAKSPTPASLCQCTGALELLSAQTYGRDKGTQCHASCSSNPLESFPISWEEVDPLWNFKARAWIEWFLDD